MDDVLNRNQPLSRTELLDLAKERIQFVVEMAPFLEGTASFYNNTQGSGSVAEQNRTRRVVKKAPDFIVDPLLDPLADVAGYLIEAGTPIESFDPDKRRLIEDLLNRQREYEKVQEAYRDDPVTQRAEAFSLYLAKVANQDPELKRFREDVLDNNLTRSMEDAIALCYSPAAALFTADWLKQKGVPIFGHRARVLEFKRTDSGWPRRVRGTVEIVWSDSSIVAPLAGWRRGISSGVGDPRVQLAC